MEEIKYPIFSKKRILKREMLNELRNYPRNVLEIYSETLSDGIICGFNPTISENTITFSKGITKYEGQVYLVDKSISIDYGETEDNVVIKLNFYDTKEDNDFNIKYIDILIDKNNEILSNQQELGRYKLKSGAYLRNKYKDLYDFTTEYNTLNIVNVLYAGYTQSTISQILLKYFANEVLKIKNDNQLDINFCLIVLNSQNIERVVICNYISYRLKVEYEELCNEKIHKKLVHILDIIKKESKVNKQNKNLVNKIIVD